jgi:hypothetical protein
MKEFFDRLEHFFTSGGDETTGIEKNELYFWIVRISGINDGFARG